MRAGTAFLLTLVLLCGAAVGADALLTSAVEREASARVGAVLDAPADVALRGWPVSLRLLQGRVPEADIVAAGVPLGDGLRIDRLEATISDVTLDLSDLRRRDAWGLDVGGGTFVAEFSEGSVGDMTGLPIQVRLGEGLAEVSVGDLVVEIAASVEAGRVVLRPLGPVPPGLGPVALSLPALPGDARIDQVRVLPGRLLVTGTLGSLPV
jgi:hypothetical protein